MIVPHLPTVVEAVFREFRTCEFSTLTREGTPVTWPVLPLYQPKSGQFVVTTSIALPQKSLRARRNPRCSLLFSDPTGSGLPDPPAVLVQGDAQAPDEIVFSIDGLEELAWRVSERQPAGDLYSSNPIMRYFCDFYFMRLLITVTPHRIFWWEHGDFSRVPSAIDMSYVA